MQDVDILTTAIDQINSGDYRDALETLDDCDNEAAERASDALQEGNYCTAIGILEQEVDEQLS